MSHRGLRVVLALVVYALATAISVALFRDSGIGLVIDGALLLGLFYYLASLARGRQN